MKNKIIICHIKYEDTKNDIKTSKDDNKPRRLIIFHEDINYIYCYNITELNQKSYYKLLFYNKYIKIEEKNNKNLLKYDSVVKLNKLYKIEKFNELEQFLLSKDNEVCKNDIIKIINKTKELFKTVILDIVEISKKEFMILNKINE